MRISNKSLEMLKSCAGSSLQTRMENKKIKEYIANKQAEDKRWNNRTVQETSASPVSSGKIRRDFPLATVKGYHKKHKPKRSSYRD